MKHFKLITLLFLILPFFSSIAPVSAQSDFDPICFSWYSLNPNNDRIIEGQISNNEPAQQWSFTGQAGTFATIRMEVTSGNLEPFVYVTDLTTNRRIGSTSGVNISGRSVATLPISLGSNGEYTVTASRVGEATGTSSGGYRLALEPGASNPINTFDVSRRQIIPQPIQNSLIYDGEVVTGQLPLATPASEFAAWHFEGQAGQRINTQLAAINGTHLQGTRLELWSLVDGTWALQASSGMGEPRFTNQPLATTGRFALMVSRVGILNYGSTVNGSVIDGLGDNWWFYGNAGDNVTIRQSASGYSPFVFLLDSFGNELNRESRGSSAAITYSIPSAGIFRVHATSNGQRSGSYSLTISADDNTLSPVEYSLTMSGAGGVRPELPPCQVEPPECPELSPLGTPAIAALNAEPMSGTITDTSSLIPYEFRVFDGSVVSIDMQRTSGDLIPFIGIADEFGNVIARSTSFDPSRASINSHLIEEAGCYYVYASREGVTDGTTTGDFSITVRGIIDDERRDVCVPDNLLGSVSEAESVSGAIGGEIAQAAFKFVSDSGGTFTVQASPSSGNLVPALALQDVKCTEIAAVSANFAGNASNPLNFEAQPGVVYYFIVRPDEVAGSGTSGEFSLTVNRQSP